MKKCFTLNTWARQKLPATNYQQCLLAAVFVFCLRISNLVSAQTVLFDKTIGSPDEDYLTSALPTPDGGYILGGTSGAGMGGDKTDMGENGTARNTDYWVVKLKADRTKEWDKVLSGEADDDVNKVLPTPDGGYLVFGTSNSGISRDKTQASKGSLDFWIVKLNANGSTVWDKTIGGSYFDKLEVVQPTRDGGYILGGSSTSGIGKDKSVASRGRHDFWVVKIRADGTKEWDNGIGGAGDEKLRTLQQTQDGGYILGGLSNSRVGHDKTSGTHGKEDYWVVKLQADGTKVWDKSIGGTQNDYIEIIQQTPEGSYILGGSSHSSDTGNKSEKNKSATGEGADYWIVKMQADGSIIWDKTIGGSKQEQLATVQLNPDGSILVGGTSDSPLGADKSEDAQGNYKFSDFWVVKLRADGSKMWDKTIGGDLEDKLVTMESNRNGNFMLGGSSQSGIGGDKTEANKGQEDYWLVQLENKNLDAAAWNMAYGGLGHDALTTAIQTRDGGYLAGGFSNSDSSYFRTQNSRGQHDYWIVKSNSFGQKLWDKRFGGSQNDYLNHLIQTQDGGYLLAGSSYSGKSGDKSEASKGNQDYWIVKVDAQGNKQWDKTFGGSGSDELVKIMELASGELVLGGTSNSPTSGDKTQGSQGRTDYWLVKISKNGRKIWDQRYGGSAAETLGSFTESNTGGFLLGGTSLSGQGHDKSENSRGGSDYWVVQTDSEGKLLWEKTYGGSANEEAYAVGQSGNSFFVAGTSNSGISGDKTQESRGGKDYWVLKINDKGIKIWDKRYGGTANDELRAGTTTSAGGMALAGKSFSGKGADKRQSNQGRSDYWLVQVDTDGNPQWDQRFGGSRAEELRSVSQTQDGGFLLGGQSDSGESGDKAQPLIGFVGTDYWLVKVAPQPTTPRASARMAALEPEGTPENKALQIMAYPNPFPGRLAITFTLPETQAATVRVLDNQGREVKTLFRQEAQANQTYQVEWQAGERASGLYFLQLQTPTQRNTQKILLRK